MRKVLNKFIAQKSKQLREEKITYIGQFLNSNHSILDVGVCCKMPEPNPSENWLEKQYSNKVHIIAVGLNNMKDFQIKYPSVVCVQADGCALPFKNNAIQVAFSNAVLEHVSSNGQRRFVEELARVVQKIAVISVPDRFSPIEIHSRIFFLHWLPFWRTLFKLLGERHWASSNNLTSIFTRNTLNALLSGSSKSGKWNIKRQFLLFIPVSLIAIFNKDT